MMREKEDRDFIAWWNQKESVQIGANAQVASPAIPDMIRYCSEWGTASLNLTPN
jgi:hypothetical protein